MSSTWCAIAAVTNYWDKSKQLTKPVQFANGVTFGPMQDWAKSKEALEWLSWPKRKRVLNFTHFCFSIEYQAASLGDPDPDWEGPEPRSMQSKVEELITLANLAIWLVCPSPIGFEVVLHFDRPGDGTSQRHAYSRESLLTHVRDQDAEPTTQNFQLAATLHPALINLRRNRTIWTAARVLWKALHEHMWEVRFLLSWVAMEALYGSTNPQETTYRLSQRAAFFLGANRNEARDLFQITKSGYGWRSMVVHGLRLSKLTPEESEKIAYEAETLLRRTFLRILENPEMVTRFDSSNREKYLDSLLFDA
jgi:hypothetical protein